MEKLSFFYLLNSGWKVFFNCISAVQQHRISSGFSSRSPSKPQDSFGIPDTETPLSSPSLFKPLRLFLFCSRSDRTWGTIVIGRRKLRLQNFSVLKWSGRSDRPGSSSLLSYVPANFVGNGRFRETPGNVREPGKGEITSILLTGRERGFFLLRGSICKLAIKKKKKKLRNNDQVRIYKARALRRFLYSNRVASWRIPIAFLFTCCLAYVKRVNSFGAFEPALRIKTATFSATEFAREVEKKLKKKNSLNFANKTQRINLRLNPIEQQHARG